MHSRSIPSKRGTAASQRLSEVRREESKEEDVPALHEPEVVLLERGLVGRKHAQEGRRAVGGRGRLLEADGRCVLVRHPCSAMYALSFLRDTVC